MQALEDAIAAYREALELNPASAEARAEALFGESLDLAWRRRGDRVEDIRSRYGISAPEMVVAACVVAGVLAFEIWFFFFAGSSLAPQ